MGGWEVGGWEVGGREVGGREMGGWESFKLPVISAIVSFVMPEESVGGGGRRSLVGVFGTTSVVHTPVSLSLWL